ncbi:MAG TPA: TlpA family protein disulfide reductase, partial [Blastocatellia bacterium]|nr:TlpA family protein disulfide reductase [Blastocatellia bacterium]
PYSESLVATARTQRKAVIIDTYADWCIPCKELDKRTFTDPAIRKEAESFVMLKLNLTKNDPGTEEGRAAKQFDIRGVPTVLFIDPSGHVHNDLTLQGFEKPDGFRARMEKLGASPSASSPNSTIASAGTSTGAPTPGQLEAVPAATVNLLSGGSLDLAAKTGKVTVIDFWATWCIPCASEIPVFNALAKQYKNQGLEIVAIALDEEGAPKVRPFLKDHKMDYTIAIGDEGTKKAFGVGEVLPVTIIVDRQGRIQYTHTGIIEDKAAFQSQIERLLKQT